MTAQPQSRARSSTAEFRRYLLRHPSAGGEAPKAPGGKYIERLVSFPGNSLDVSVGDIEESPMRDRPDLADEKLADWMFPGFRGDPTLSETRKMFIRPVGAEGGFTRELPERLACR